MRQAYRVLKHAGYRPWLDEEELFPGQDWELEIPAALRASEAVVVFLSKVSVSKRGYVQREFRLALDALQEIPQGRIFVIPIKLDDCDVPPLFRNLQWSEWTDGLERVLESLTRRLGETARNGTSTVTVPNERMIALARHDQLRQLEMAVQACTRCRLGDHGIRPAVGRGGLTPSVMILGEGPGASDQAIGLPFAGAAGLLLDKMVSAISLTPDDVYIANVIKCRAPANRRPHDDEVAACRSFWERQAELVAPRLILTLGSVASGAVLQSEEPMSALRGRWGDFAGIPVMPTYHPAYLLRHPEAKTLVWQDLKLARERLVLATG